MAPLPLALPDDWLRRCWVLAGPTAAGKTAVGLQLAERIGAEILCLDSMTLYRGLDIGTAKPTLEERARVPHHLLDRLDPHEECSVADYLEMARDAVADVFSRGRIPLFVGGSGMYLRALLRGLCASPPGDEKLRAEIAAWADAISPEALHAELRAADPAAAARLHPRDRRRILRALEVFRLTGRPLSALQNEAPRPTEARPRVAVWLSAPRAAVYDRIDRRVAAMFAAGLEDEILRIGTAKERWSRTASQAIGYRELLAVLRGEQPRAGLIERIQTHTRQFAKRQWTWFRNLAECEEFPIAPDEPPQQIAERIAARGG